jgi:hypothetical protein
MNDEKSQVAIISQEIKRELADASVSRALLTTTFNGLNELQMKQALMEGMIRGFTFEDFMKRDVYAIPYGGKYSLITAIDYNRKIGMQSGIVGKDAPVYVMDETGKKIISCSVTVHRKIDGYVGAFTAEVYFAEYSSGKNLWLTKPRTMIAKVAEMHALRMACPEVLAKQYIEEEIELGEKTTSNMIDVREKVETSNLTMGNFAQKNNETTIKIKDKESIAETETINYPADIDEDTGDWPTVQAEE